MAEVPDEYLAFMHDLISAYHQKLTETLSPKVAETFRDIASDSIVKKLGIEAEQKNTLSDILSKWGIKSQVVTIGDDVQCHLECPYATIVHPLLTAEHPICPLSFMTLGVVRLRAPASQMIVNGINSDGAQLTVRRANIRK